MKEGTHWFVIDPIGHRSNEIAMSPPTGTKIDTVFGEAEVINVTAMAEDEWVCDLCNASIPLYGDDEETKDVLQFVAMLDGYALCVRCVESSGGIYEWLKALKSCACGPCFDRLRKELPWLNLAMN